MTTLVRVLREARVASQSLAGLPGAARTQALHAMAGALRQRLGELLAANRRDVASAERAGRPPALVDRLRLDAQRVEEMARGVDEVAGLPDPLQEVLETRTRPNGLVIEKVRVPIGVIAIIYEARPNVTVDCAGLCVKSGNSVVLRGGREALASNQAIVGVLQGALRTGPVPKAAVQLVGGGGRTVVGQLLRAVGQVDLVIPRGGEGLIREVVRQARVPVIKQYKGVCHTYVDDTADLGMAERIVLNAKVQRPGVCNAMETLLVHERVAGRFLPQVGRALGQAGVEIRGCPRTRRFVPEAKRAKASDWGTEFLDLILAVRVVRDVDEAMAHIRTYGSGHSEAIVTEDAGRGDRFLRGVDAACVYVNASTRFTDGGQFGMGAEIGISTDKLHARGPMGLAELTSYKYLVRGQGQVRT